MIHVFVNHSQNLRTFEPSQRSLRWAADKLQEKSSMMLSKKQLQGADLGVRTQVYP